MNINMYLGRILLVISLFVLTSCAKRNDDGNAALNADDLWDWMAAEKTKPLPENDQVGNSDVMNTDKSPAPYIGLQNDRSLEHQLHVLQYSKKKYDTISTALETSIRNLENDDKNGAEQRALWRTVQLYLSRLSNLKNEIHQAMTGYAGKFKSGEKIPPQDIILFEDNVRLMAEITEHISRTRNSLNKFTQNE
ncbi:hypothetical protein MNBD_ALPHA02-1045 [hydrothermal vent metagenome]|uniref:Uncharacterized protein n=1 Tax=hydrothermal vent metagenome TaxID=652676 RepID=A0A3B0R8N4_9ZZZZ